MSDLRDRMERYVTERRLINRGDRLVLGLSGGADSICLLNILSDISKSWHLHLIAVHVNHGIRGEEADRDAEFSRSSAELLGAEFILRQVNAPEYADANGLTLEESARILRYSEFESVLREKTATAIVLAHHADDQAETVLMNLFRGTGPTGMTGMHPVSGNRIRPLLFAGKKDILRYLKENRIEYVEDSTNLDTDYTRNRIRNVWLPEIEKVFPEAGIHIAAAAEDIGEWHSYVRNHTVNVVREAGYDIPARCITEKDDKSTDNSVSRAFGQPGEWDGNRQSVKIPVDPYLAQESAIRHEWIREVLLLVIPGAKDVGRKHFRMIEELFINPQTGRACSLPGGCQARREYEFVIIEHKSYDIASKQDDTTIISLPVPGSAVVDNGSCRLHYCAELVDFDTFNENKHSFFAEKDYTKFIDYGKIRDGLCLRKPREGDFFVLNDHGECKRLNRFFIDRKLPSTKRNCVVLADGSHVVWVMDRLSAEYMVSEQTDRIVKITRKDRE